MKRLVLALFVFALFVVCDSDPFSYEPHQEEKRPFKRSRWVYRMNLETVELDITEIDTTE